MNFVNCIFCNNLLDNSDEHIIPECLNGRLRSQKLICHKCNSNKFGRELEPKIKQLFNTTLLILGLKNANSVHSEDPEGAKFLYAKNGNISPIKPEFNEIKKEGKTYISVNGGKRNAIKYFAKQADKLLKKGYAHLKFDVKEIERSVPFLRIESKFEITKEIILELNKIAIEFYAYSGLELSLVKHISERVNLLDAELSNVVFCNWRGEIRTIGSKEISHLIVLRTNNRGVLYCYIELFNIICAYIKLHENCQSHIDFVYHQDAISGKPLTEEIHLNLEEEPINKNDTESFEILINNVFDRLRERNFSSIFNETLSRIKEKTEREVKDGVIHENDLDETIINRCCDAIAHLTLSEFPYMIEDFKDEENHELNYIHSNLKDTQFEEFCKQHHYLIGIKVNFHDDDEYLFKGFTKQPFLKRNGIVLVKVYCVLTHSETNRKKYIPYRDFFEGIISNQKNINRP